MSLYANSIEFNLTLSGKWKCPKCGAVHEEEPHDVDPYRIPAEEPVEDQCKGCNEWIVLSLYSDEYNAEKNEEYLEQIEEEE